MYFPEGDGWTKKQGQEIPAKIARLRAAPGGGAQVISSQVPGAKEAAAVSLAGWPRRFGSRYAVAPLCAIGGRLERSAPADTDEISRDLNGCKNQAPRKTPPSCDAGHEQADELLPGAARAATDMRPTAPASQNQDGPNLIGLCEHQPALPRTWGTCRATPPSQVSSPAPPLAGHSWTGSKRWHCFGRWRSQNLSCPWVTPPMIIVEPQSPRISWHWLCSPTLRFRRPECPARIPGRLCVFKATNRQL